MIKEYQDGLLVQVCSFCGTERKVPPPTTPPQPVPDGSGRLSSVVLPPCDTCGAVEHLNPELPTTSEDMEIADKIPDAEWRQRTIVRALTAALKARKPLPAKVPPIPKEVRRRGSPNG